LTVLWIILGLIAALLAVILLRAAAFRPKKEENRTYEDVSFDKARAIGALQTLIRFKTVSYREPGREDDAAFDGLVGSLPALYPALFGAAELTRPDGRSLLFRWPGKEKGAPSVLMAHYDVVPVEEENWEKPPFDAVIEDGVLWGRGSLDTKVTFNGILFAADTLVSQGFRPENDVYLAFSGGEEINGQGAVRIVEYFKAHGITPALVVDEGGAVVENVFPGVKDACGLIGIAEKGLMDLEYRVVSGGGHASAPPVHTPVGELAAACKRVEDHPFPMHLTKPAAEMFDTLGRRSSFLYRMIFANLWCFGPVLDAMCKKSGGELNALLRTTVAFTQMQGSKASNVIPPSASLVSNIRLNPEDTMESAVGRIGKNRRKRARRAREAARHGPQPHLGDELPGVGQGGLGRRGDVARLYCLAVSHGAVLGQPALPRPVEPRLPLLRDGPHGGGAQNHPWKQRAHPAGDSRTRGGIFPAAHKAVLKSAAQPKKRHAGDAGSGIPRAAYFTSVFSRQYTRRRACTTDRGGHRAGDGTRRPGRAPCGRPRSSAPRQNRCSSRYRSPVPAYPSLLPVSSLYQISGPGSKRTLLFSARFGIIECRGDWAMEYTLDYYQKSADFVKSRAPFEPELAIVLGSSLGPLAEQLENPVEIAYAEIPNFLLSRPLPATPESCSSARSRAKSSCACPGRFHSYEGYSFEQLAAPMRLMKLLGVRAVILTNAAGGVNLDYKRRAT
jgi:carboxypeptidase PM20D1